VGLGKKARPYLQNNKNKNDWRYSSSRKVPATQVRGPEFEPQYYQKQKIIIIKEKERQKCKMGTT
jgi:hypothetical protein